jgi:hypothetical protein
MILEGCNFLSLLLFSFAFPNLERVSQKLYFNFSFNNQLSEGG